MKPQVDASELRPGPLIKTVGIGFQIWPQCHFDHVILSGFINMLAVFPCSVELLERSPTRSRHAASLSFSKWNSGFIYRAPAFSTFILRLDRRLPNALGHAARRKLGR
ncbi:hypothetical protein Ae201684P_009307 [Aphanomyces euteiches]|nr:hypothetical protein Ae201684P_009307 [Aphanomyces euteiches]